MPHQIRDRKAKAVVPSYESDSDDTMDTSESDFSPEEPVSESDEETGQEDNGELDDASEESDDDDDERDKFAPLELDTVFEASQLLKQMGDRPPSDDIAEVERRLLEFETNHPNPHGDEDASDDETLYGTGNKAPSEYYQQIISKTNPTDFKRKTLPPGPMSLPSA